MKPIKNRFFCNDCGKIKMLFETEKKANNFIKFNSEEIEEESGFKPERSYFCIACNGWHVTHHKEDLSFRSITEKFFGSSHNKEEQKTSEEEEEQKALFLAQKKNGKRRTKSLVTCAKKGRRKANTFTKS